MDEWHPEKDPLGYDVREQAGTPAKDEQDQVDVGIGLRLSHRHELLLPHEGHDECPHHTAAPGVDQYRGYRLPLDQYRRA